MKFSNLLRTGFASLALASAPAGAQEMEYVQPDKVTVPCWMDGSCTESEKACMALQEFAGKFAERYQRVMAEVDMDAHSACLDRRGYVVSKPSDPTPSEARVLKNNQIYDTCIDIAAKSDHARFRYAVLKDEEKKLARVCADSEQIEEYKGRNPNWILLDR